MSDQSNSGYSDAPMVRVIEVELREDIVPQRPVAPRVTVTELTERVTPSEPANVSAIVSDLPRRRDGVMTLALGGIAVFFVGWLVVDAVAWVSAAFDRGTTLGLAAAAVMVAGVAGAGAVIGRETVSLFRLKNVEAIHRRLAQD